MSKFYGVVKGASKTEATRRGHSRIETTAASWSGAVRTTLWETESGEKKFQVWLTGWHGATPEGGERLLAEGVL